MQVADALLHYVVPKHCVNFRLPVTRSKSLNGQPIRKGIREVMKF
jgi:hypothetical protein